MPHESGSDWNSEKLQKYLSASNLLTLCNSSGTRFICEAMCFISRVTDQ